MDRKIERNLGKSIRQKSNEKMFLICEKELQQIMATGNPVETGA